MKERKIISKDIHPVKSAKGTVRQSQLFKGVDALIVSKNKTTRDLFKRLFLQYERKVKFAATREEALGIIEQIPFLIIIIDFRISKVDILEFLRKIKEIDENSCVIVVSAHPSVESAVEIMREGGYDYLSKPFLSKKIRIVLERAIERQRLLQEARQKRHYQKLSILDGLTNVYNYRYFHEFIEKQINRARRYNQFFSLFLLDIDDFKKYNDTRGHLFGDRLLRGIASSLKKAVRAADTVFRYGGDEFVVLLPMTTKEQALKAGERLQNVIKHNFPLTVSIGISNFPEDGGNKDSVIKKADLALYQAKHLGKNKICLATAQH